MTLTNQDYDTLITELINEINAVRNKYDAFSQFTETKVADFVHTNRHLKNLHAAQTQELTQQLEQRTQQLEQRTQQLEQRTQQLEHPFTMEELTKKQRAILGLVRAKLGYRRRFRCVLHSLFRVVVFVVRVVV